MSKPKKLITVFKISNSFPPNLPPLNAAFNASWSTSRTQITDSISKNVAKVNVNAFMICGSKWLWPLCRWHYPVLPSPFRGHARDDGAPPTAGTMKGTNMTKWKRRQLRWKRKKCLNSKQHKQKNKHFSFFCSMMILLCDWNIFCFCTYLSAGMHKGRHGGCIL